MDIEKLFNCLSEDEKNKLDLLLYKEKRARQANAARKIKLNKKEREMAAESKVSAIRLVKDRLDCELMVAKMAVDNFLEKMGE